MNFGVTTTVVSYETLDAIADSVNPMLGVVSLTWPWLRWGRQWRLAASHVLLTLLGVALAYAVTALDRHFEWWAAGGLDFSTHTAVCVALIVALCFVSRSRAVVWICVLFAYAALMVYQHYHTVLEIVTSGGVVAAPVVFIFLLARRFKRAPHIYI